MLFWNTTFLRFFAVMMRPLATVSDMERPLFSSHLVQYFENPACGLVDELSSKQSFLYVVPMKSLLLNKHRVLCITSSVSYGKECKMQDIRCWTSIQLRTLDEKPEYLLRRPVHSYDIKTTGIFSLPLLQTGHTPEMTFYRQDGRKSSSLPISFFFQSLHITLLHRRKGFSEYPMEGTLAGAIETYQCIIQMQEDQEKKNAS